MGEIIKPYEGKIFKLIDRLPIKDEFVPAYTKQKRFETSVENIPKRFGVGTGFLKTLTRFLAKSEVGKYPKEYKPRIHGPYYPSRYYGTATPLAEVKLAEVPKWIATREKSFTSFARMISRAFWKWNLTYLQPKRPGMTPLYQMASFCSLYFFIWKYKSHINERHAKYH